MRSFITSILIVFSCLLSIAQNTEVDNQISDALEKIKSGDSKGGLRDMENIFRSNSNYIPAITGNIIALYQAGKEKDAMKAANQAIVNKPNNANLHFNRGLLYNYKGDYNKALLDFNKALDLDSDIEDKILLNRGLSYEKLQQFDNALADFESAIELKPNNAKAFYKRGVINYRMNNFEEAIDDFSEVISIQDDNAIAHYNRGMALYKVEKIKEACVDFQRSCQLGNKNACRMVISECNRFGNKR